MAADCKPKFENQFTYKIVSTLDTPQYNASQHFGDTNKFISEVIEENSDDKVLIHCFPGKSRASVFTIAYLIAEKQMNLKESLELVKGVRPVAAPNPGFMAQL